MLLVWGPCVGKQGLEAFGSAGLEQEWGKGQSCRVAGGPVHAGARGARDRDEGQHPREADTSAGN